MVNFVMPMRVAQGAIGVTVLGFTAYGKPLISRP
jgi:hypothetical protein